MDAGHYGSIKDFGKAVGLLDIQDVSQIMNLKDIETPFLFRTEAQHFASLKLRTMDARLLINSNFGVCSQIFIFPDSLCEPGKFE